MKGNITAILLLFSILLPIQQVWGKGGPQRRKTNSDRNHILLSASTGYSQLIEDIPTLAGSGRAGCTFGVGFEQLKEDGLWWSASGEFQYFASGSKCDIRDFDLNIYDTRGLEAMCHFRNFTPLAETQNLIFCNLLGMVGFFNSTNGFYCGIGAKLRLNCFANSNGSMSYTTSATYEKYIDDFANIDPHFYGDKQVSGTSRLAHDILSGAIQIEVGGDVLANVRQNNKKMQGLKIGFVAEVGIPNLLKGGADQELFSVTSNATELKPNSFYNTTNMNGRLALPVYAGVKATWMFCLETKHHKCSCRKYKK